MKLSAPSTIQTKMKERYLHLEVLGFSANKAEKKFVE